MTLEDIQNSLSIIVDTMHKYLSLLAQSKQARENMNSLSGVKRSDNEQLIQSLDTEIHNLKPLMNLIRAFHYCSKNLPHLD